MSNRPNFQTIAAGLAIMAALVAVFIGLALLTACGPQDAKPVAFTVQMEDCFQRSTTCAAYLECSHRIQEDFGLDASTPCNPDGGAP